MLKIRNLTRPGLMPADLDLAEGECVALGGPSGSGKSIFLRAIVDLDPNDGDVSLDGISRSQMSAPDWRKRVCYVPAEAGWWADRVAGHFPDPDKARPLMVRMGLSPEALDWEVTRLSTGERQRLALCRALLSSPKVLLLDEPTSGLDPDTSAKVEAMLLERLQGGAAMVIVTHDAAQAGRMAKRRMVMDKGVLSPVAEDGA